MTRHVLDTNIIIRFTVRDDPQQASVADTLFRSAADGKTSLILTPEVLAETVWVLESTYDQPRDQIAASLFALAASREIEDEPLGINLDALSRYGSTNLDIVDCLLAARCVANAHTLASFDKGIAKRCSDVTVWPGKRQKK